ncbi:hypothetical protein HHK36_029840 [Tetracentron sinense]|uniref:Tetraspanin-8 n=1 Tax=Tetracentron sinense TaxID=13715 RepID=A0A834YBL5_TETSI|nr:hypothetical protein HHK36_029840 [Tetracentron sinense]
MFRISNNLIGIFNIISLLISIPIIVFPLLFLGHRSSECEKFLQLPLLIIGLFILVVSVLGIMGSYCRSVTSLLWIYLVVMFLLIIGLVFFTIFSLVVTNKGAGEAISRRGFKEHRLGDYTHWLQKYMVNGESWVKLRSCLSDSKVCTSIGHGVHYKEAEFYRKYLSPIESGCCKPPGFCGFEYKNATFWTVPKSGPASMDSDCTTWSNDQQTLCYDCMSCKAGVLANLKKEWKKLAIFNVCLLIFLVVVYTIGCCALRNNRSDNRYKRRRGYP